MLDITSLNNGLKVVNEYIENIDSVSVNIFVRTGSKNETKKNNGISHFLEHMAFKGTKTRTLKNIAEEFDDIGGRVNAFTSKSKTAYYAKVLYENIEKAVELLADIFQNSSYLDEEIEKERQVILQELAMGKDDPTNLIYDYFEEICYADQPYGRTIIGPAKNIKNFSRNDILSYVNNQYKTQDIVISFAGKLKNDEALKLVNKYFNNLNIGKNKLPENIKYTGGYFKKNKKLEQSQLLIGFESCSYMDDKYYHFMMLSIILGSGMSSRLFQEIREKRGLCYTIYSSNSSNETTGVFEIYSAVSSEKINETIIAIIDELKKISENITENEFKRAISKLKSELLISRESNSFLAKKNASNILDKNKVISINEIIEKIEKIKIKDLQNLIFNNLLKSKPSIAILGKIDDKILNYDQIIDKIKK